MVSRELAGPRRLAAWALVAGLCVAAVAGVAALVAGSFDDTDWRVIASSLGFSVFSATGAAGATLRLRRGGWRVLGWGALVTSGAAFILLLCALWIDPDDGEGIWQAWGVAGVLALASSHACLMLGALRPGDSAAIRTLTGIGVAAVAIDSTAGILGIIEVLDGVDSEDAARALGSVLLVALLCTALAPILRRMQRNRPDSRTVAAELAEIADRLEAMPLPPEARREVDGLRAIAGRATQGLDP